MADNTPSVDALRIFKYCKCTMTAYMMKEHNRTLNEYNLADVPICVYQWRLEAGTLSKCCAYILRALCGKGNGTSECCCPYVAAFICLDSNSNVMVLHSFAELCGTVLHRDVEIVCVEGALMLPCE